MRDIELPPLPESCQNGNQTTDYFGKLFEYTRQDMRSYARAIESAACAERDARIAELEAANEAFGKRQEWWSARMLELEQQLAEARKDAERYRFIRDADRSDCITQELSLYAMETLDEYVDAAMEGEAELAIRAAIKDQT